MKNKCFAFPAIFLLTLAFANCTQTETKTNQPETADTSAAPQKMPVPAEDPSAVVAGFYNDYDASPDLNKALSHPALHPDYVNQLKGGRSMDYDVVINAQDCICCKSGAETGQCKAETLENTGATAKVKLINAMGEHHATVDLVNGGGKWLIKAVDFTMD